MKRLVGPSIAVMLVTVLVLSAHFPAAAAPARVDYPAKGKSITLIVPFPAGGATDVAIRVLALLMEKDLGVPIQIVNRPGAAAQVGTTALATSKPDGYTIGLTSFPHIITAYLDPARQAVFSRSSFEPIGVFMGNPVTMTVQAGSPYKTLRDVIGAAKASPGKIRAGTTGILGPSHLGMLQLQKVAGVKLALVHFDGGRPQSVALLGGHIDMANNITPEVLGPSKDGQIRILGVMDKAESPFLPGVKTFESQGFPVVSTSDVGVSAPAGTPKEIVAILAAAMKKAASAAEWKHKMEQMGNTAPVPDPSDYVASWQEWEARVKPLMELAKEEAVKR